MLNFTHTQRKNIMILDKKLEFLMKNAWKKKKKKLTVRIPKKRIARARRNSNSAVSEKYK